MTSFDTPVEESRCPVTGLPVLSRPEWNDVELDEGYRASFFLLGDSILVGRPTGFGTMNKNSSVANHGGMGGSGRPELDLEVTWDDGSEADPVKGFVLYHTNREIVVIPPGGWFDPLPIGEYTVRVVLHPDSDEPEVAIAGTYTVE